MKKLVSALIAVLTVFTFVSCAEPEPEGKEGFFSAKSAVFDIVGDIIPEGIPLSEGVYDIGSELVFTDAPDGVKDRFFPASIKTNGEYSPVTEELLLNITADMFEKSEKLSYSSANDALALGNKLYSVSELGGSLAALSEIYDKIVTEVSELTSTEAYVTKLASLDDGSGNTDCREIALTLDAKTAENTLGKALSDIAKDGKYLSAMTDVLNMLLKMKDKPEVTTSYVSEKLNGMKGDLKWVRFISGGRIISERLAFGELEIAARLTENDVLKEFTLIVNRGENELISMAFSKNIGTKDTVRLILSLPENDYVTALVYECISRHVMKSGSAVIDINLRRAENTVFGLTYDMSYKETGANEYTLEAAGSVRRKGQSIKYDVTTTLEKTLKTEVSPLGGEYAEGGDLKTPAQLTEAAKGNIPTLHALITGE